MKSLKHLAVIAVLAMGTTFTSTQVLAQNNRPSPDEMRARMLDNVREQLDVKNDDEWKLISERVTKVMEAQRETRGFGNMGAMFGRGRRGGNGGNGGADAGGDAGNRRRGGGPFGEPSAETEALQKAIDSKASADEIKAKLAKFRDARKEKRAKLEKAQADLKEVLSQKQEATAVILGLIE